MIDPKLHYCTGCSYQFKVSLWQNLLMLLRGSIIITCPQCQCRMRFKLIHHAVKVDSQVLDKKEVYKYG